jgi:Holliday junction resolvase RusA-like endonuclease
MTRLSFTVIGLPAPQGSKRFVGFAANGRAKMMEASKNVKPWREAIAAVASDAYSGPPLDGPLGLIIEFRLTRYKSTRKDAVWQISQPDASKLLRSTEDALQTAGVVVDDSRFCFETIMKVFSDRDDAWTGARVHVWQIDDEPNALIAAAFAILEEHAPV